MSELVCGSGFLTLNQSILIVVIATALVVIAMVAIVIISCQYNKVIKTVQNTAKQMIRPAITSLPLDEAQREEINRRNSLIPRPQMDAGHTQQQYSRTHSLPGLSGHQDFRNFRSPDRYQDRRYMDSRNGDPRYADPRKSEPKRSEPRSAEPRMITAGGAKKISDKPRDDTSRSKPNNPNREKEQSQEQKPAAGLKIPMQRKADKSGSKDWGQEKNESFPFYAENDRGKINPFYQESGFSDNFTFKYPDQPKMNADRYF